MEPAAKRRNCLRERGERRALLGADWAVSSEGFLEDALLIAVRVGRCKNAIPLEAGAPLESVVVCKLTWFGLV